jgi:hypothetical protein
MPDPQDALQMAEALALTGATTVAAAMATDAWHTARAGTARLFHRGGQARKKAIEDQLEAGAMLVARAPDADRARCGLVPLWQLELEQLLRDYPGAAGELQALVDQVQAALPETRKTWVQTNIARDNGRVFAAQGGNVIVHQVPPGLTPPPAPGQGTAEAR